MKKIIILFAFISSFVYGQKQPLGKYCVSDEAYQELVKKDPDLSKRMEKMDEEIRTFSIKNKNNKPFVNGKMAQAQTNYTIPVIVYVVHDNQPLGVNSNISDAQVQSQIAALNTYFVGSGLNFCLATKAGNQNLLDAANVSGDSSTTPGIVHVNNTNLANHTITPDSQQALVNGTSGGSYGSLTKDKFLRIWVVKSIGGGSANTAGYSYFPNTSPTLDGIVMDYKFFGDKTNVSNNFNLAANYLQGKTLAHEVGHYFGLRHTFEGGCHDVSTDVNRQILGDRVSDTPPVAAANFGCPSNINSCTEDNLPDDISNYMDYTYDACKDHFTTGQKDRMLFHLLNYRSNLYDIDNLIFTGACGSNNLISSNFTGSLNNTDNSYIYNICSGSTMYFKPVSRSSSYTSGTVSYLWDFGNGQTSTLETPSITYSLSSNSFYTVTLTVTYNGNNASTSKEIYVNNCTPIINKETTWYYASNNILNFNTGVPRTAGVINFPGKGITPTSDYSDGTFSNISMQYDNTGNLLFFTDGTDVFNSSNPASKINNNEITGNRVLNSSVILKSPVTPNQFYIINTCSDSNYFFPSSDGGTRYSVVNIVNGTPTMSDSTNNIPIKPTQSQTDFLISSYDQAYKTSQEIEVIEKIDGGYWIIT